MREWSVPERHDTESREPEIVDKVAEKKSKVVAAE